MQFPPIKKGGAASGLPNPNPGNPTGAAGPIVQPNNDNYVKNIKKNPQNQTQVKPGVVVSGLGI